MGRRVNAGESADTGEREGKGITQASEKPEGDHIHYNYGIYLTKIMPCEQNPGDERNGAGLFPAPSDLPLNE
jgi:hypothetical protein